MKTYETPEINIIELHAESMLALSKDDVGIDPNNPGTPATNKMNHGWNSSAWDCSEFGD